MSIFNSHTAHIHAVAIVTAAMQSQSIKLRGPDVTGSNDWNIEMDVKYINGLINGIAANLTEK